MSQHESSDLRSGPVDDEHFAAVSKKKTAAKSYGKPIRPSVFRPLNTLTGTSSPASDDHFTESRIERTFQDPQVLMIDDFKDTKATVSNKRSNSDIFGLSPLPKVTTRPSLDTPSRRQPEEGRIISSLLYPDDKAVVLESRNDTIGIVDIQYIQCGDVTLKSDDGYRMYVEFTINNNMTLSITKTNSVRCTLDNINVTSATVYTGPQSIDKPQFVDIYFSKFPREFSQFNLPADEKCRLRIVSKSYSFLLENTIPNIFKKTDLVKDWDAVGKVESQTLSQSPRMPSLFDDAFNYRRQSSRLVSKPSPSYSESIKNTGISRYFSSRRSSRSTLLSDILEPDFPEKPVPLFVYPESGIGAVTITTADTPRLETAVYLNDSLVDFDMRYLLENADQTVRSRIHLFSSFLYKRLSDDGQSGVKTWTEDVDIFSKDFLIVPICEHLHWYLAIICYPGRLLKIAQDDSSSLTVLVDEDSTTTSNSLDAFILIFDSLGRSRHGALNRLKSYLVDEARDKLGFTILRERIHGIMVKCPHQTNYTDCGLFCSHFFDYFLKDPYGSVCKAQSHQLANWFPASEAMDRRQVLKERIAMIASTSAYVHPPDTGNSSDIEEIICLDE